MTGYEHEAFRDFELAGWNDRRVGAAYHAHFSLISRQAVEPLLDAVAAGPGRRLLDVASGAGYVAGAAAARGAEVVGLDFAAAQLELARASHPDVRFEEGDAQDLPFPDASFDAVVCNYGIMHFPDPELAIHEAFRVLTAGGRFAFAASAAPDEAAAFGAVYGAIQAHGSMEVGLPLGPNYFLYSDPVQCEASLDAAGFAAPRVEKVPQVWHVASPEQVFHTLLEGTVRASATLRAQSAEALAAIAADLGERLAPFKTADGYEIPMPAVLASASKP